MYVQDYILNGQGHGSVADTLMSCRGDTGMMRPFFETNPNHPMRGRPCVIINTGRSKYNSETKREEPVMGQYLVQDLQQRGINSPVFNATSLRKEEWLQLDQVVLRAARYRLRAWADLSAANAFGGFNGMSKMILEHETMSDPGEAQVDMDGLTEGRTDAPQFQLQGLPLPITHSDFWFSSRRLAVSRNSGTPLDTTMGEASGRRVAERVEKTLIGTYTGITYGGNSTQVGGYGRTSSVYGYTNFPSRLTSTNFTKPTSVGWTPAKTLEEFLAALDQLRLNKFYGPFMVYTSNDWDQYMDNDYIVAAGAGNVSGVTMQTLRNRLRQIDGIADVRRLDFLFATQQTGPGSDAQNLYPFTLLFVQMTPDVARAVNGMDITTVQWESVGGMRLNFKVMCIQVPQLRADFYGNCGILHATATK
jgi:hypothetical protein